MHRTCGLCGARLVQGTGHDNRDGDYRGNAVEVDDFTCTGCARVFRHVYRERFSGDSESWSLVEGETTRELARGEWPKSG